MRKKFYEEEDYFYDDLNDFIKKNLKSLNRGKFKKKDIANELGISYEYFRKLVNHNKTPRNPRDFVIAICMILYVDEDEANIAIQLYGEDYGGLPPLEYEDYRDGLIIDILDKQLIKHLSIDEVNARMRRNSVSELDIIKHHNNTNE